MDREKTEMKEKKKACTILLAEYQEIFDQKFFGRGRH